MLDISCEAGAPSDAIVSPRRPPSFLPDVLWCLALAAISLIFFWRFLAIGRPQLAYTFSDFTAVFWPLHQFDVHEWLAGRVPLWNNSIFGGQPQLADLISGVFYPFSLVEVLVAGRGGVMSGLYLRLWLDSATAAMGMYFLVRRWTGDRFAGAFAGVSFSLSSFATGFGSMQMVLLEAMAWVPFGLFFLDRALAKGNWFVSGWLAGWCFGISILAGYPQMSLLVLPAAAGMALYRWRFRYVALPGVFIIAGIVALASLSLAAIQLAPSLEFLANSNRATSAAGVGAGYHLGNLLGFVLPSAAGDKGMYLGLLPLILALPALLAAKTRAWGLTWLGVAALGFLIAMGENTPLYGLIFSRMGFGLFRGQSRTIALTVLSFSIMGGLGLAAVRSRLAGRWPWLAPTAIALAVANLLIVNWNNNWPEPFRPFTSLAPGITSTLAADSRREPMRFYVDQEILYPPNEAFLHGLESMNGDIDFMIARTSRFQGQADFWRQLQLFNVRWTITQHNLNSPGFEAAGPASTSPKLYRMKFPLPRAYVVWQSVRAQDPRDALAKSTDNALNPGETVVLEEQLAKPLAVPIEKSQSVRVTYQDPQHVHVQTETSADGFLVLSYPYYPGWKAMLDDRPAQLFHADYAFEGLPLPGGRHVVTLWYEPASFKIGAAISALSILAFAFGMLVVRARSRINL